MKEKQRYLGNVVILVFYQNIKVNAPKKSELQIFLIFYLLFKKLVALFALLQLFSAVSLERLAREQRGA